jgi:multidrug efflux pump subunit AcrB
MIRFFAAHPTGANLLMLIFLIAGALSLPGVLRETQPDFTPTEVEIRIPYPGATAREVEEAICRRVENAVDGISFVEEIRADARENLATITVEMQPAGDIQTFIRDIETGIDAIDDFPQEIEPPVIRELGRTDPVLSVLVSGPMDLPDLKAYCEDLKDRLQEAGVALVTIQGFSDHQLRVSLSDTALRQTGLSAATVADRIAGSSLDIPLGLLETRDRDILLRFTDQRQTVEALENLVILATPAGGEIRLRDIATVTDRFDRPEEKIMMNGRPQALVAVAKTKTQDAIQVAEKAKAFIAAEQARYPQVALTITQDQTAILTDRLNMLVTNGIQGLLLVFATMWLFFNIRVSLWVVMGLPVSFFGAFILLPHLGLSINMFTMVGLLMALGLLMDDAIVLAENIMAHRQQGKPALSAAVDGVREVGAGVIASFITTICILGPLAFIGGQIGRVLKVVPMMLILVLAVSLIEAFLILPGHLNHAMHRFDLKKPNRFRQAFNRGFDRVRTRWLGRLVTALVRFRYLVVAVVTGLLILSIGLVASGKIQFQGFPELEGDVITARLLLPQGTPLPVTESRVDQILAALDRVNQAFSKDQPGGRDLVKTAWVQYNVNPEAFETGPHAATITVDLLTAEQRSGTIDAYLAEWRRQIGPLPDVASLTLSEPGFGPGGRPIEIRLRGHDLDRLKQAVTDLHAWFNRFDGVVNLADDLRPGKPELRMHLKPGAHGLGLDAAAIARQVRAAFQGVEADAIQVGPEPYEIDVRLTAMDQNSLHHLENFSLFKPDGTRVPLTAVVTWEITRDWARIARFNGMRAVTLRGDVDTRKLNTSELIRRFNRTFHKEFSQTYPDLNLTIAGSFEETNATRKSMLKSMLIGFIGIFILLSFQFRTFTEPLIVMVAIPFSLIGVIAGHGLMGVPISMPSLLGFIALGGVVVNDAILLVLFLKNAREQGLAIQDAAVRASQERFRAVLLTTFTTIAGLMPLLFEKSLQAQILIPLVISTTFGLMASSTLVLLVIPCMYRILGDFNLVEKIKETPEEALRPEPSSPAALPRAHPQQTFLEDS